MTLEEAEGEETIECAFCKNEKWHLNAVWSRVPYLAFCSNQCYNDYFTYIIENNGVELEWNKDV